jgi:hypothetical protein
LLKITAGQFHKVPAQCVVLITMLGQQCPGEGVRPTSCGEDCIEYEGIDYGLWGWMGETAEKVLGYKPSYGYYAKKGGKGGKGQAV